MSLKIKKAIYNSEDGKSLINEAAKNYSEFYTKNDGVWSDTAIDPTELWDHKQAGAGPQVTKLLPNLRYDSDDLKFYVNAPQWSATSRLEYKGKKYAATNVRFKENEFLDRRVIGLVDPTEINLTALENVLDLYERWSQVRALLQSSSGLFSHSQRGDSIPFFNYANQFFRFNGQDSSITFTSYDQAISASEIDESFFSSLGVSFTKDELANFFVKDNGLAGTISVKTAVQRIDRILENFETQVAIDFPLISSGLNSAASRLMKFHLRGKYFEASTGRIGQMEKLAFANRKTRTGGLNPTPGPSAPPSLKKYSIPTDAKGNKYLNPFIRTVEELKEQRALDNPAGKDAFLNPSETAELLAALVSLRRETQALRGLNSEAGQEARAQGFFTDNALEITRASIQADEKAGIFRTSDDLGNLQSFMESLKQDLILAPQCFLSYNLKTLHDLNLKRLHDPTSAYVKSSAPYGKTYILRTPKVAQQFSKLTRKNPQQAEKRLKQTTDEFGKQVPNLRLYKVIYEKYSIKIDTQIEFPFPNISNVTKDSVMDAIAEPSLISKQGYGIKSFSWEYVSSNPATYDNDIEATLVLYLQDFEQFTLQRQKKVPIPGTNKTKDIKYRLMDLLVPTNGQPFSVGSIEASAQIRALQDSDLYYDIKAEVGWAGTGNEDTITSLFLSAVDYNINFSQDGSLELSINYRARTDSLLYNPKICIDPLPKTEQEQVSDIRNELSKLSDKAKGRREQLQKRLESISKNGRRNTYSQIIKNLTKNNSIYYDDFSAQQILKYKGWDDTLISQIVKVGTAQGQDDDPDFKSSNLLKSKNLKDLSFGNLQKAVGTTDPDSEPKFDWAFPADPDTSDSVKEYRIYYFFFGDLIDTVSEMSLLSDNLRFNTIQTNTDPNGKDKFLEQVRVALGSFQYTDPQTGLVEYASLADMPISASLFAKFYYEKVVSSGAQQYPYKKFLHDLVNYFLKIYEECLNRENISFNLHVGMASFEGQSDPLEKISRAKVSPSASTVPMDHKTIDLDKLKNGAFIKQAGPKADIKNIWSTIVITPESGAGSNILPRSSSGGVDYISGFKRDIRNGVYHLFIGNQVGLVKNINFERTDQKALREQRFQQQLDIFGSRSILSNVFDVTIDMYGNNLFLPGKRIFINPTSTFSSLGKSWMLGSDANVLGLGGYHIIIKLVNTISPSGYETKVVARFESSGMPPEKTSGPSGYSLFMPMPTTGYY